MKTVLLIGGVLAVAIGLLWAGQGSGLVHWPASSMMISQIKVTYYGGALALAGWLAIRWSRR